MRYGGEATEHNEQLVDRYSIVHAGVGALFEASGVPAWLAIGSHVAFEVVENAVKRSQSELWPDARPDALANHVGDVASFTSGYYASRKLRQSDTGKAVLTGFMAIAAGVWTWSLVNKHSWRAKPKAGS